MERALASDMKQGGGQHDAELLQAREARVRALVQKEIERVGGRRSQRLQAGAYPLFLAIAILVLWEAATHLFAIPKFLLPAPTAVSNELVLRRDYLLDHSLVTFWEVIGGFLSSLAVGLPLAVLITSFKPFERMIYPLLVSTQVIPKVAIAPLLIVWFGTGFLPKLIMAFLVAFFPIVVGGVVGLKSTPPEMLHLVRSMGATPWQSFWEIRFPSALPSIFGGVKVAITLSVVGAVVAEFVGGSKGLGYLVQLANGYLDSRLLFASLVLLSAMGIVLFLAVDIIEKRMLRWHVSGRHDQTQATL